MVKTKASVPVLFAGPEVGLPEAPGGAAGKGPRLIPLEYNLEGWPLFSRQRSPEGNAFEVRHSIDTEDGRRLDQLWRVTASADHSLPNTFDEDVFVGVMALVRARGGMSGDGRVRFSTYELVKAMRKSKGGDLYKNIRESLDRIGATSYYSQNAFYVLEDESLETYRFSLWEVHFSRATSAHGRGAEHHTLKFADIIVRSYNTGYLGYLDPDLWFALNRPLAKALYRLIDRRRDGSLAWSVNVHALRDLLQMSDSYKASSRIWQSLSSPHKDLKREGFLLDATLEGDVAHYKVSPEYASEHRAPVAPAQADPSPIAGLPVPQEDQKEEDSGARPSEALGASPESPSPPPSLCEEAILALRRHKVWANRARALVDMYGPEKALHAVAVFEVAGGAEKDKPGAYLAGIVEQGDPDDLAESSRSVTSQASLLPQKGRSHEEDTGSDHVVPGPATDTPVPGLPEPDPAEMGVAQDLWPLLLEGIANHLSGPSQRVWFEGTEPRSLSGEGLLVVTVPNRYAKEYIEERFKPALEEALRARLSRDDAALEIVARS